MRRCNTGRISYDEGRVSLNASERVSELLYELEEYSSQSLIAWPKPKCETFRE